MFLSAMHVHSVIDTANALPIDNLYGTSYVKLLDWCFNCFIDTERCNKGSKSKVKETNLC